MKKLLFITLTLIAITTISCSNTDPVLDYTDPKVLSGTTWRASDFTDSNNPSYFLHVVYIELRFTSITNVEMWSYDKSGGLNQEGSGDTYAIVSNKISFPGNNTGIIDGTKMEVSFEGNTCTFIKM